jgi:uncharacterized membrane protein
MPFNHHILLELLQHHDYDMDVNSLKLQLLSDPEQNLQSYSNTCEYFKIKHAALTVPKEAFAQLPEYFIAQLSKGVQESVLLIRKSQDGGLFYRKDAAAFKSIDKEEFLKEWTGVVFAVERNETKQQSKPSLKTYTNIATICAAILWIAYLGSTTQSGIPMAIAMILITGCYLSYLLLQSKYKSGFSAKICHINKATDCTSVINSKQALLFGKIELTDVCMVFFSTLFVTYTITSSTSLIGLIAITGTLILPYSIYVQAVVLKKWCPLCLGIATSILILAAITIPSLEVSQLEVSAILVVLFSFALSYYASQLIKGSFKNETELYESRLQYNTLWRSPHVINTLINNLPVVDTSTLHINNGLKTLSPNEIEITVVTNPTCPGCKVLHDSLSRAIATFKEHISIQYLFLVDPTQKNKKAYQIATLILSLPLHVQEQAINEWFNATNEIAWKKKWLTEKLDIQKGYESLVDQVIWCNEQKINYSPTLTINNRIIPNNYTSNQIKDLITAIKTQQATAVNNSFLQDDGRVKAVLS